MAEIAVPDQKTFAAIIAAIRALKAAGFMIGDGEESLPTFSSTPILFQNTEGSEIPAWACMQVDGTLDEASNSFIKVKKPTADGLTYIFNGPKPVAAGDIGNAQAGSILRGYKNSGSIVVNEQWAPTTGQWYLTQASGPFVALGADNIDTNVLRVTTKQQGTRIKHVKAPAGGVPAFNTGTLTLGSATCTEYGCTTNGVLSNNASLVCWNAAGAVAANAWGTVAQNEAGLWIWQVEKC